MNTTYCFVFLLLRLLLDIYNNLPSFLNKIPLILRGLLWG